MTLPLRGLDVDEDMTRRGPALKAAGFDFIMRYLKNTTKAEVEALRTAGLTVGFIWESTATRALQGSAAGSEDGKAALAQVREIGAPASCAVYVTVDDDVGATQTDQLAAIGAYFDAFDAVLWPDAASPALYQIGGYADGSVLSEMRRYGLPYTWLAGAMGWDGSKEFEASANPCLIQGPTIRHGLWHGAQWPDVGFEYDPDLAMVEEWGGWAPQATGV